MSRASGGKIRAGFIGVGGFGAAGCFSLHPLKNLAKLGRFAGRRVLAVLAGLCNMVISYDAITSPSALFAAAIVLFTSRSLCAVERNHASNWEGGG